jgi:glycosyltransferase involved in cell wall biosynthesis
MFVLLLLFYSSKPTPAYAEIARGLRARGHRVWVGQPSPDGAFVFLDGEREAARLAGPERGFASRRDLPGFMLNLRRFLATLSPDVVQVTPAPWSWMAATGLPSDIAVLNDIRTAGAGAGYGWKARLVDSSAWMSWRAGAQWLFDRTLFLNETGARWLLGPSWADRADVVPLGVTDAFLAHAAPDRPRQPAAAVRFVYLGTISLDRHLDRVLLAVHRLRSQTAAFSVSLLGPDDGATGRHRVGELIERHELQRHVRMLDPVPYVDVPDAMLQFDVALNYVPATRVQRRQTFLKVLECRALGLPQITTLTGPNTAVVLDGENGLLVRDDPDAYANAMRSLVQDPSKLDRLRIRARELRSGTTWTEVAARYETVYEATANARRPRHPAFGHETP